MALKPPNRAARGADHADLEPLDGAAEQDGGRCHDEQGDHRAEMQPACFDQQRHGGNRIELGRGREVEALRVAPGPAHEIIEKEVGDIDQHQAGQDFAGAELDLADRGDQRVERAGGGRKHEHRRQDPDAGIGALRLHRDPASRHGPDQELALGADVPGIGEIAQR